MTQKISAVLPQALPQQTDTTIQIRKATPYNKNLTASLSSGNLNFYIDGKKVSRDLVQGIDLIKANSYLTPENIKSFLQQHSFRINPVGSIYAHPTLLGGGQLFVVLPSGKTITVDINKDSTAYREGGLKREIEGELSSRENLQPGQYSLVYRHEEEETLITESTKFGKGNLVKNEATLHLTLIEDTPVQKPIAVRNAAFRTNKIALFLILGLSASVIGVVYWKSTKPSQPIPPIKPKPGVPIGPSRQMLH